MEQYTGKYEKSGLIGSKLLNNYFKVVEDLILISGIKQERKIRVFEVGCGAGFSTERLLDFLPRDAEVIASDIEDENVKDAKLRLRKRVRVYKEDIYSLKEKDSSVDLIFALEVFEHLDNPEKALSELKRISKGYLILGVPREPIWRLLNFGRGKYWASLGNTPGHIQHWSSYGFKMFLERNSLEVIKIRQPLPWTLVLARVMDTSEL